MERLRFLHIPKTAGSTFTSILNRQYYGKKKFTFTGDLASNIKRFEALSKDEREKVVLFTGHAPIATGIREADDATIITFLRDPITRVKSFCQHVSEGKSTYLINDFPPNSFDLDHFLRSGINELSNLQTKMLINHGTWPPPPLDQHMSASEARDAALKNLFCKISYFGLQEYFDESLIIFSSALNWRMPFYASQNIKNISKLIEFEKRHLALISELNAIDIEVYKLAREQFIKTLHSIEFDKGKLKRFQAVNAFASPILMSGELIVNVIKRTTGRLLRLLHSH